MANSFASVAIRPISYAGDVKMVTGLLTMTNGSGTVTIPYMNTIFGGHVSLYSGSSPGSHTAAFSSDGVVMGNITSGDVFNLVAFGF